MKIAIFTDSFLPQVNGVVTHIVGTTKEFVKLKYKVLIIAPRSNKEINKVKVKGIKIKYIEGLPAFFYPGINFTNPLSYKILKIVKIFNPDIIHFHTPITMGLNAIIAAKYLNKPLVSTFHTYFMEPEYLKAAGFDRFNLHNNRIINKFFWQYARFFYNQSDIIIAPSQSTKDELIKHGFTKPIKKVNNGINKPIKQKESTSYSFKKYFLYVGRLSKEKNIELLINSFKLFSITNKKTHLVIVGEGPLRSVIEKEVLKNNLSERVHLLGVIPNDILLSSNLFTDALAFVSPSTSEVQPFNVLEACAYKLPIITVQSRAMTELVNDNGILCKPNNVNDFARALVLVASNHDLRRKFRQQSSKLSKKYLLTSTIKQLEEIYLSLYKL